MMMTPTAAPTGSSIFIDKTSSRELRVGIIGLGNVGLRLALLFSEQKFRVMGFDVDWNKVDTLTVGGFNIYRIILDQVSAAQSSGFRSTANYYNLSHLFAVILCVS